MCPVFVASEVSGLGQGRENGAFAKEDLASARLSRISDSKVYQILSIPGLFAIFGHLPFDDSRRSTALYMTELEQHQALVSARFSKVNIELSMNGLVLYAAGGLPKKALSRRRPLLGHALAACEVHPPRVAAKDIECDVREVEVWRSGTVLVGFFQ